jgi:hypothetical protein
MASLTANDEAADKKAHKYPHLSYAKGGRTLEHSSFILSHLEGHAVLAVMAQIQLETDSSTRFLGKVW